MCEQHPATLLIVINNSASSIPQELNYSMYHTYHRRTRKPLEHPHKQTISNDDENGAMECSSRHRSPGHFTTHR